MRWQAGRRSRHRAVTLGWELISASPEEGTIEVAFAATEAFSNPAGVIQGGFLAAMLDDTLGPALAAGLSPGDFAPTTDLHVQFLRPARPGRLVGRGWVVRRGRDVGFLAGELRDADGAVVAVATATVQIRKQMLAGWRSGEGQIVALAAASTSSHTEGIPVSSAERWVSTTTVRFREGTFDHAVPSPPSQV
jgi:uncharacterized protein (TIGR00369 family)